MVALHRRAGHVAGRAQGRGARRCGPSPVGLHRPSSSRPPCLLFLGLSLRIFWAAAVGRCLAESPDALQPTCQLQQQGNELERKAEGERERKARRLLPSWAPEPHRRLTSFPRPRRHRVLTGGPQLQGRQLALGTQQRQAGPVSNSSLGAGVPDPQAMDQYQSMAC